MLRRAVALAIAALGIAVGVFTLHVARDDPGYWFAGSSALAGAALLAAGWALIAAGLASWLQRPGSRWGLLLVSVIPFVSLILFFITGMAWGYQYSWLWFLLIPLVGAITYGTGAGRRR